MMKIILTCNLMFIFLGSTSLANKTAPCQAKISIKGVDQTKKGKVCVYFFSETKKEEFPFPLKNANFFKCSEVKETISIEQEIVNPGNYAFMIVHDEDQNHELKTNWIGMPKEGVYASNGAKGRFGPPSFDDAKIQFNKNNCSAQEVKLRYL